MKKNLFKNILAALLVASMTVSSFSLTAFADEATTVSNVSAFGGYLTDNVGNEVTDDEVVGWVSGGKATLGNTASVDNKTIQLKYIEVVDGKKVDATSAKEVYWVAVNSSNLEALKKVSVDNFKEVKAAVSSITTTSVKVSKGKVSISTKTLPTTEADRVVCVGVIAKNDQGKYSLVSYTNINLNAAAIGVEIINTSTNKLTKAETVGIGEGVSLKVQGISVKNTSKTEPTTTTANIAAPDTTYSVIIPSKVENCAAILYKEAGRSSEEEVDVYKLKAGASAAAGAASEINAKEWEALPTEVTASVTDQGDYEKKIASYALKDSASAASGAEASITPEAWGSLNTSATDNTTDQTDYEPVYATTTITVEASGEYKLATSKTFENGKTFEIVGTGLALKNNASSGKATKVSVTVTNVESGKKASVAVTVNNQYVNATAKAVTPKIIKVNDKDKVTDKIENYADYFTSATKDLVNRTDDTNTDADDKAKAEAILNYIITNKTCGDSVTDADKLKELATTDKKTTVFVSTKQYTKYVDDNGKLSFKSDKSKDLKAKAKDGTVDLTLKKAATETADYVYIAFNPKAVLEVPVTIGAAVEKTPIDVPLTGLKVTKGEDTTNLVTFDATKSEYTVADANGTYTITPTAAEGVTFKFDSDTAAAATKDVEITANKDVKIVATNADGKSTTYTIKFTYKEPEVTASITGLEAYEGTSTDNKLTPAFNADTLSYTVAISNTYAPVKIKAVSSDTLTYSVDNGQYQNLTSDASTQVITSDGSNVTKTIKVKATASDGTSVEYTIVATIGSGS